MAPAASTGESPAHSGASDTESDLDVEARPLAQGWTSGDALGLLPLYVGGDLEPVEQRALDLWLAEHPAARPAADAAFAARRALRSAAAEARAAEDSGPDLWPGIRAALDREGWLGGHPVSAALAQRARFSSLDVAGTGAPAAAPVERPGTRPARRRWLASSGAAAAGLVFTAGLAWLLGFGQPGAGETGTGASSVPLVVHTELGGAGALSGGASEVQLVAGPEAAGPAAAGPIPALPAGVIRLGASSGAPLEQHAVEVDLGHHLPGFVRPAGGASLAGDVEAPRGPELRPHPGRR